MIHRLIEDIIEQKMNDNKAIIIMGARQVGKTTLIQFIFKNNKRYLYWNGDEWDIRELLANPTSSKLKNMIGNHRLIVIDEAQRIENIGICIKLIVDNIRHVKIIATGSSSFDLSNKMNESLAGRKWEYVLYPLSFEEMANYHGRNEEKRVLEQRLVYGYYPEVVVQPDRAIEYLKLLLDSYLYKDILIWGNIKKPEKLERLVKALALQIGQEVSYNELSEICGLDNQTIEKYIDLLEKCFVIYKLMPYSTNSRNELKKMRKIYFYDLGIRNAAINNFNPISVRNDKGALWENYLINERLKYLSYKNKRVERYFWRNKNQQEIDYIEIDENGIHAFQIKYSDKAKSTFPKEFIDKYSPKTKKLIHIKNYDSFIS